MTWPRRPREFAAYRSCVSEAAPTLLADYLTVTTKANPMTAIRTTTRHAATTTGFRLLAKFASFLIIEASG